MEILLISMPSWVFDSSPVRFEPWSFETLENISTILKPFDCVEPHEPLCLHVFFSRKFRCISGEEPSSPETKDLKPFALSCPLS